MKKDPLEKETLFLYNKHNSKTKFPLVVDKINFPPKIIKILNKTTKRTKEDTKILNEFREKILNDLKNQSDLLQYEYLEEKEAKNKEKQEKRSKTIEENNSKDPNKFKHFGVWFDKNDYNKLSRDNYAIVDKKVSLRKNAKLDAKYYRNNPEERKKVYENEECTLHSQAWCDEHREKCLLNYDYSIQYFNNLEYDKFEKALNSLLKKRKAFKEIKDLNECKDVCGIYVMVLDEYKQVYIGQSDNIKRRVLQHWSEEKDFNKLIWGTVENSILSIDVFGCLDTTRIFVLKEDPFLLDSTEYKLIEKMNQKYLLNRREGGSNVIPSMIKTRKLI